MKALVTGGAGFIGSNIVKLLVEEGHRVVVLDNMSSGYRENLAPYTDVEVVEGDIRDPVAVEKAMADVELVFHLAASVGNTRSIDNPVDDAEINLIGTIRILEGMRAAGARKIVVSSSAGIFGELQTLPIAEDHPLHPDSPYGVSKLAAEKVAFAYQSLYSIEVAALRYFNVYGVNQRYDAYGNVIPIFAHRIFSGEPILVFGDGEQTRDFVNVRDVARANYLAGTTEGATGAFNLGSGTRVTINDLAATMIDKAGVDTAVEHRPPRPGDVRHSLADLAAAQRAFGFQPSVSLDEGLTEYLAWAREAGV